MPTARTTDGVAMSVDLKSETGEQFEFRNYAWHCLSTLAEANGFDDAWCIEPEEGVCIMPAAAAARLADAVQKSLIGGDDAEIAKKVSTRLTELLVEPASSPLFRNDPIEFTERGVAYWRDFIRFARLGGFTIRF
jgi:hypothetical protein